MIYNLIISETLHQPVNPNQFIVLSVLCLSFSLSVYVCVAGWGLLRYTLLCRTWLKVKVQKDVIKLGKFS